MDDFEKVKLCTQAINLWGIPAQVFMCLEELAELQFTICKFERSQKNKAEVIDEIADVNIMNRQLMTILGISENEVRVQEDIKWERLKHRIEKAREEKHNRGRG